MSYGEVRIGPTFYAYPKNLVLGVQEIRPVLLDSLNDELRPFNMVWEQVKFLDINRPFVPDSPGVYYFYVSPKAANIEHHIILYFGKAKTSLRNRYVAYLTERRGLRANDRDKIVKMLNIYKNQLFFCYCLLDSYDVEKVEDCLIKAFCPPCNTTMPKFEPAF